MPGTFIFIMGVLSTFAPLIPLFIYIRTRQHQKPHMRFLALLMLISTVADVIGMARIWINVKHLNIIAGNFSLLSSFVLTLLFYQPLFNEKFKKIFYVGGVLLFLIICCQIIFYRDDMYAFNGHVTVAITVIVLSLWYFFILLKDMPTVHIQSLPMFWINTGFLLYSSCNLILFIISYYLTDHAKGNFMLYWTFHNTLNIVQFVFFAIGLWQVTKKVR